MQERAYSCYLKLFHYLFLWFGDEPSRSRYLGRSVGRLVGLSVSTQISKQGATLPNYIPACRSEFFFTLASYRGARAPKNDENSGHYVIASCRPLVPISTQIKADISTILKQIQPTTHPPVQTRR